MQLDKFNKFGEYKRFKLIEHKSRFGYTEYFVKDAEYTDQDGLCPGLLPDIQTQSKLEAIDSALARQ